MISCNGCCKHINEDNVEEFASTIERKDFCEDCLCKNGMFKCDWCGLACVDKDYDGSEDYSFPEFCDDCEKERKPSNNENDGPFLDWNDLD